MMFKKKLIIGITIIINIILVSSNRVYADDNSNKKSLIVYETRKNFKSNIDKVNHLSELLYVFNNKVDNINIDDYKKGYLNNYDYIFVININNDIGNKVFLEDINNYNKSIYWIGDKIENLLEHNNKYSIKYISKNNNITSLNYKGDDIILENESDYNIIQPNNKSKIISTMSDGYNTYPYILQDKNLYYISNWDMYESYIFEDTLNDFFKRISFDESKIFVKIDDVNPLSDTKKLKDLANYLYKENVPFIVSLTPAYLGKSTKTLDENIINTMKYMQEKGGSVILNGYSHSRKEKSNEDEYEFFNKEILNSKNEDVNIYIKNRLLSGLRLCIENDIYPLGFEPQKYAITQDGYKEIKKYISTYIGRYQNNSEVFKMSTFPYVIKDSKNFNTLIPENLGYIAKDDKLAVDKIKYNYYKLSMVRGHSGGFFFHTNVDTNYLKECIEYFKSKNVSFLDLKKENNYINIDDIKIESNNKNIITSYDKSKSISKNNNNLVFNKSINKLNDIVIEFVVVVLLIFILIFIVFKIINRRNFTRR
ncbi:DUF2334 domain-containing protein [Romboutsia sp. 1001713B170131_170501_G6]|uniref:DUF2334 domain-containing protein n=1 Tax=Romboutsia sp. 1001713B170131_170501_G6 TaxID=2787108 RepID=UPI0018AA78C0|nr:DUF2334 domain-containing protein [Romboutsia sp. 1001713B170131_170501_G6]